MDPVLKLLEGRFARLKIKEEAIKVNKPATEEEISDLFSLLDAIDPDLKPDKTQQKELKKSQGLQNFLKQHCRIRQYMFQVCFHSFYSIW